jgi:hypothetical protein
MNRTWLVLLVCPLLPSCLVPLGYTDARAQGYVSDSASAQYLQLSLDYFSKGAALREASSGDEELQTGLDALVQEFDAKVDRLTGGASESDEIATGDDTSVPRRSIAGVALTEALQGVTEGRSLGTSAANLEAEYTKVIRAEAGSRGLFLSQQSIWPQNTVRYRWASADNPSPAHRRAILDAMTQWSQASGGRVNFAELENTPWVNFQLTIGVLGCILIQDATLEPGVVGRATIGYQCGTVFGYLKLDRGLPAGAPLRRTSLHELGHVLGLIHEHKRPDRDQWINVSSGGYSLAEADMGKVDEFISNLRWRAAQLQIGPWSITLYFPVWWTERYAQPVGTFDLKSVMIYSGFETLRPWTDPSNGVVWPSGTVVPWNTTLSPGDSAAVRALYP